MAISVGGWDDVASLCWVADVVARSTSSPWAGQKGVREVGGGWMMWRVRGAVVVVFMWLALHC